MEIHPQIIQKDGKSEFVILPYDEFIELKHQIEDYEDLKDLREAKSKTENEPGLSLNQLTKELELKETPNN